MVIQFKKAIFLNFGYSHTVETLWRMGTQIEQHWQKKTTRQALMALFDAIDFLKDHTDSNVSALYDELNPLVPFFTEQELSLFSMKLERILGKELKDQDFLISTQDTTTEKGTTHQVSLVLDNLRSAYNVGSLFRTAEALGVNHIYLCGLPPSPDNTKTSRTALGSDQWIPWSYHESSEECLAILKKQDVKIYSLETADTAIDVNTFTPQAPCTIVLGNERYGIAQHLLTMCDEIISIPMQGRKNSLNVGVCGGIALHTIIKNLS